MFTGMNDSTKRQQEILDFIRKYQQKNSGKQSAPSAMGGHLYENTVWSQLFFESSRPNLPGNKSGKSKSGYPTIFPA
jgi:hypothetical protein